MRAAAPDAAACDRCHAPLAGPLGRDPTLADEGVTCIVCHSLAQVNFTPEFAQWNLQLQENRMYSGLCSTDPPYFHRVGCSPLHREAEFCGACHHLRQPSAHGPALPIFTTVDEWRTHDTLACQGCHMAKQRGDLASGTTQTVLSHHGSGPAPGDAVTLEATVALATDGLEIRGQLRIDGVAHKLPAGLPGRTWKLVASLVASDEAVLASDHTDYHRVLVDDHGHEVAFFAATREASDTRLQPETPRPFHLQLPPPPPGATVLLQLQDIPLTPALAQQLGISVTPTVLVTRTFSSPWGASP